MDRAAGLGVADLEELWTVGADDVDSPIPALIRTQTGQAAMPTGAADGAVDAQPGPATCTVQVKAKDIPAR